MTFAGRFRIPALLLGFLLASGVPAPAALADDVDTARALPRDEALERLDDLIRAHREAHGEEPADEAQRVRAIRLHAARGELLLVAGRAAEAIADFEYLSHARGEATDHIGYAEGLVAAAADNVGRSTAAGVVPYLQDALEATDPLEGERAAAMAPALRARLVHVRARALYWMNRPGEAAAAIEAADPASLPQSWHRPLHELLARCLFARKSYEPAARAFLAADNARAAAATWDTAGLPAKSIPLYQKLIEAEPGDAALLAQALRGARYGKAQRTLAEFLDAVAVPEGRDGVPLLLLRAALWKESADVERAKTLLRDAGERDGRDARALAELGRLLLPAAAGDDEAAREEAIDAWLAVLERDAARQDAVDALSWLASLDFAVLWRRHPDRRIAGRCVRLQERLVQATGGEDALVLANLGNTLRVLGRAEEALERYEAAVEANPYDPDVASDRGLALSAAGRGDEALAAFRRAVELDPGHLAGHQNAARALWLRGEDDAAAAHLDVASRTARTLGRGPGTYRFLLDRVWRTRRDGSLR